MTSKSPREIATKSVGPRVSVLMPVFNAMPYLEDASRSMLNQTFGDFEILAIDDGSSDGSVEFLREATDERLRCIADGRHRGLAGALNLGLARARGEFIARMDADDFCTPDRLALQVEHLARYPRIGAVGTQFTYFGNGGRQGFARPLPSHHATIMTALRRGNLALIHGSLMIRTDLLRSIDGYRLSGVGEDWDMFLRLGEIADLGNLPQRCYYYRLHGTNNSSSQLIVTHARIAYARRCAEARSRGQAEPTESEFQDERNTRSRFAKMINQADYRSLSSYLSGRNMVLNGQPIRGYILIAVAAALAPWRLLSRVVDRVRASLGLISQEI